MRLYFFLCSRISGDLYCCCVCPAQSRNNKIIETYSQILSRWNSTRDNTTICSLGWNRTWKRSGWKNLFEAHFCDWILIKLESCERIIIPLSPRVLHHPQHKASIIHKNWVYIYGFLCYSIIVDSTVSRERSNNTKKWYSNLHFSFLVLPFPSIHNTHRWHDECANMNVWLSSEHPELCVFQFQMVCSLWMVERQRPKGLEIMEKRQRKRSLVKAASNSIQLKFTIWRRERTQHWSFQSKSTEMNNISCLCSAKINNCVMFFEGWLLLLIFFSIICDTRNSRHHMHVISFSPCPPSHTRV